MTQAQIAQGTAAHARQHSNNALRARSRRCAARPLVARGRLARSAPGHTPGAGHDAMSRLSLLTPPRVVIGDGLKAHVTTFDLGDLGSPRASIQSGLAGGNLDKLSTHIVSPVSPRRDGWHGSNYIGTLCLYQQLFSSRHHAGSNS